MKKYFLVLVLLTGCSTPNDPENSILANKNKPLAEVGIPTSVQWNAHWFDGKAELTSYRLEQARYGEMRTGEAVTIFVTEDFSASKQVKLDRPSAAGEDRVPVLKLNLTKKFQTGIYPYSLMTSVFTPLTGTSSLKVTTSVQEWCGHIFMQYNLRDGKYSFKGLSYFESEGEETGNLPKVLLEDEVWTKLRLHPEQLPTGNIKIIPSTLFSRLHHHPQQVVEVLAEWEKTPDATFGNRPMRIYKITYANPEPRTLRIAIETGFPFAILGWTEAYNDGFGKSAPLVTKAIRKKTTRLDYWSKNTNADLSLRKLLE
ncbi:MAG: hypothetical protein J0L94_00070 [Rhodothermia bacterium]|nr:hypothetical protein [Rhodothermia bacterium]